MKLHHVPGYGEMFELCSTGCLDDRPNIERRDFDRVGTGPGRTFSTSPVPLCGDETAVTSTGSARAASTFLTPSRISSDDAPCGAVVVRVSVARILPSGLSSLSLLISSSVTKRSFSKRTSRPRLWQYHRTKSRTKVNNYQPMSISPLHL